MQIFIKQTIDSLREVMGYEDWEEINEDALLFQQGYDGDIIEVEDGEIFEIDEGFEGQIVDEGITYFMKVEILDDVYDEEEVRELSSGSYRLDGKMITSLD